MTFAPPPGFQLTPEYRRELLEPLLEHIRSASERGGRVVGVYGPQGSGKSTLVAMLANALSEDGWTRVAVLSLDDYYLPLWRRSQLADEVHPLFAVRGPPGTHEIERLRSDIARLRDAPEDEFVEVPRFDKSVDDRAPNPERIAGGVDIVLVEGWCLAVPAEPEERLEEPCNRLERENDPDGSFRRSVNARLATDYEELAQDLDFLIALTVPSFDATRRHRHQQEEALRRATGGGMSVDEVDAFMDRFERITRWAMNTLPERADVHVALDDARRPLASIPAAAKR